MEIHATTDPHKNLASALGRIPSGVFILTLAETASRPVCSQAGCSNARFKPPMISFVIQHGRPIAELLANGAVFTLNILESAQTDMIAHFGKGFAVTEDAFTNLDL